MMELSRAEYLAVSLMLAYMEPSAVVQAAYVVQLEAESGLTPAEFDLANVTACEAAQMWLETNPRAGRRLLRAKLARLTAANA
jgi:hypothetical protein